VAESYVAVTVPVPVVSLGGTWSDPLRAVLNCVVSAWLGDATASNATLAIPADAIAQYRSTNEQLTHGFASSLRAH